eukprot:scaffold127497_cov32-Tisochrysis_lutea.AAC.4
MEHTRVSATSDDPRASGCGSGCEPLVEGILQDWIKLNVLRRAGHGDDDFGLLYPPELVDELGELCLGRMVGDDDKLSPGVDLRKVYGAEVRGCAASSRQDGRAKEAEHRFLVQEGLLDEHGRRSLALEVGSLLVELLERRGREVGDLVRLVRDEWPVHGAQRLVRLHRAAMGL